MFFQQSQDGVLSMELRGDGVLSMELRGAQNIHSLDGTSHTTPSSVTAGL